MIYTANVCIGIRMIRNEEEFPILSLWSPLVVFLGCPNTGLYYGADCCSNINCRYCYMETGTCLDCKPGYKDERCQSGNHRLVWLLYVLMLTSGNHFLLFFPQTFQRWIFCHEQPFKLMIRIQLAHLQSIRSEVRSIWIENLNK